MRLKGIGLGLLAATAAASLVAAFSCIPDLPSNLASPDEASIDAPVEEGTLSPRCGDGIIQLDAGEQCDPGAGLAPDAAPDATYRGCTASCQFVCPGFLWPKNNHCYTLDSRLAGSLDEQASVYCQDLGANAHVVTFASDAEVSQVVSALAPGEFWVGLEPVLGRSSAYTPLVLFEPGWTPTCPGCFAEAADAAAPLPGNGQACVAALGDAGGAWQQYPCSDAGKIQVVCEREPTGVLSQRCEAGVCIDLVWTHGQKSYVYVSTAQTGDVAEQQCESLGGTLVVLQSRDEREQLWHELGHLTTAPGSVWIGLSQQGGDWVWADDAAADAYPSPWGDKQPAGNGSRAYLVQTLVPPTPVDTTLGKNDVSAQNTLAFVCQVPPASVGP